jgi:MFS family permease
MANNRGSDISTDHRYRVATFVFLGWMFAGIQLAVVSIVMREAVKDLMGPAPEGDYGRWFGWLTSAFMFGAAAGGYVLGWFGDRYGRRRAILLSILGYSLFSGATYFVSTPTQLLWLRFLVGFGVGGMWPNGIALVSEVWPRLSRPAIAGVIGTAANVGTMLFAILACFVWVTTDSWRWVNVLGALPVLLAMAAYIGLPESPKWLQERTSSKDKTGSETDPQLRPADSPLIAVFRPPILQVTVLGIVLGTIPLFGGWGSSNWANAWASEVGERVQQEDPALKARTLLARSAPGSIASLLGGLLASYLGRRTTYCVLSIGCLVCSQCLFRFSHPGDGSFLGWTAALGIFNGFFFGWLPLCLPEMFPTRVRATGAGVSFNFGRIATSLGILVVAALLKEMFGGDYSQIGQFTSWVYLVGALVIWAAPRHQEPHAGLAGVVGVR